MRIDVVGRHFEVTDAIRSYAEQKAGKLTKYYGGVSLITVNISKTSSHNVTDYEVELVIGVERHDDFISKAKGADPYAAMDLVAEKGERQLRDYKEKLHG